MILKKCVEYKNDVFLEENTMKNQGKTVCIINKKYIIVDNQ